MWNFEYRKKIGNKAEDLIKRMMEELGFMVIPFGYEYLFPTLANKKKLLKGQAGDFIRGLPDFIIVDKKTNYTYFIEVKYRRNGEINLDDIAEIPESWVILVEYGKISICKAEYAINNPRNENCFNSLTINYSPFKDKDKKIILKYVEKTKEI